MPTNKERRDVAERLRILATHREVDKELVQDTLGLYMGECIDGYDPVSVNELANLIEPRTCRKVPGRMKYGDKKPACSECGYSLGDSRWNFCPKCGCEVVE